MYNVLSKYEWEQSRPRVSLWPVTSEKNKVKLEGKDDLMTVEMDEISGNDRFGY